MKKKTTNVSNWWDKLGKPQYGGEITIRASRNLENFDPYFSEGLTSIYGGWMERLVADDWTLDPAVWDFKFPWHPSKYLKGQLAESWEFPDPSTHVLHLRKGINWQNIPPANGREFTSDDVAYHYHRLYGGGHGFTQHGPGAHYQFTPLESVTVIDKYTVAFKWKAANVEIIRDAMQAWGSLASIEAHEVVEKWGNLDDWHHAIGTGPFILKDMIPGNSATLVKNPNYWGHDEQNPHNQLPYIDTLKILIIPEKVKAIEALCVGKIDVLDGLLPSEAQEIRKTNPELLQVTYPAPNALTIDPRNDVPPFNNINIRKAMQMAIDLPTICRTYYNNNCRPYPSSITSYYMTGWGFPYEEWPQDLRDEYAYNPTMSKELLAIAGYPHGFKTNIVADATGDIVLLQIVKTYFAAVGIDMEIRTMDHAASAAFIYGRKHDALSQRGKIGKLGALGLNPVNFLSRIASGPSNYMVINDPVLDAFHPKAWTVTSFDEVKKLLRDCNEYVARQHFLISLLQPMECTLYQPWFKGYNGQRDALSGADGPHLLFYYPARFWIDRNLKKSMGHSIITLDG